MADQLDALLAPVIGDRLQVEIGRRLCETELVAMAEPIAVPALVPTLDEHAAEAVLRREVDILLRPLGRRAMLGARSEEHTSELQSLMRISYAVFCLKKKNTQA